MNEAVDAADTDRQIVPDLRRALVQIALHDDVPDRVLARVQGEGSARIMVDVGVGETVAGRMGQEAADEGAHLGRGVPAIGPDPHMVQPGVAAGHAAAVILRDLGVDDLLAGHDVRIGVGAQNARPISIRRGFQGGEDLGRNREVAERTEDHPRARIDAHDRYPPVVERVLQRNLRQLHMGGRLPRQGYARRQGTEQHQQDAGRRSERAAQFGAFEHDSPPLTPFDFAPIMARSQPSGPPDHRSRSTGDPPGFTPR
ncbi:hypothetical protein [Brevundimonas sp. TWP2-3-4b1]|uniref:hypothetical protein n=1 Tax=Brevundimonas sp. TWP2-3-4b1 TaxID=2804580 RepID=UPI003CFB8956